MSFEETQLPEVKWKGYLTEGSMVCGETLSWGLLAQAGRFKSVTSGRSHTLTGNSASLIFSGDMG